MCAAETARRMSRNATGCYSRVATSDVNCCRQGTQCMVTTQNKASGSGPRGISLPACSPLFMYRNWISLLLENDLRVQRCLHSSVPSPIVPSPIDVVASKLGIHAVSRSFLTGSCELLQYIDEGADPEMNERRCFLMDLAHDARLVGNVIVDEELNADRNGVAAARLPMPVHTLRALHSARSRFTILVIGLINLNAAISHPLQYNG